MPSQSKNIFISCLVVGILACVCVSLILVASAGWLLIRSEPTLVNLPSSTSPSSQPDIHSQMDQIQTEVIKLRGLQPGSPVERILLTPAELRERVKNDFFEDYSPEEATEDALVLYAFHLLEKDFDLMNFYIDLLSEQVAGFYDNEEKAMYVVREQTFAGPERLTYAHEYQHALQDQNYDIREGLNYNDEACEQDSERCLAVQALLEGDASLLELNWFTTYASREDRRQVIDFYDTYESPIYDQAPAFMQEDFLFPYQQGQEFVQALYDQGGWTAIDQAFINLPVSSEQILHPERYPADQPVTVSLPDLAVVLEVPWRELDQGVMGEWYTYLILAFGLDAETRLDKEQAKVASEGWGGDRYVVYYHETDQTLALVLKTVWDTSKDADEFVRAFENYANARFERPEQSTEQTKTWQDSQTFTAMVLAGNTTIWLQAPEKEMMEAMLQAVASP